MIQISGPPNFVGMSCYQFCFLFIYFLFVYFILGGTNLMYHCHLFIYVTNNILRELIVGFLPGLLTLTLLCISSQTVLSSEPLQWTATNHILRNDCGCRYILYVGWGIPVHECVIVSNLCHVGHVPVGRSICGRTLWTFNSVQLFVMTSMKIFLSFCTYKNIININPPTIAEL